MSNKKQNKVDRLYMQMAFKWAENSYAIRRKVGALIVKNNSIISDGYNGTPSNFPNVCEYCKNKSLEPSLDLSDKKRRKKLIEYAKSNEELITYPYVLHAESNAITKLAKSNNSSVGATLYVTDEPCLECAKLIIQAGISKVIYSREYRKHDGIELLREAKVKVKQIKI